MGFLVNSFIEFPEAPCTFKDDFTKNEILKYLKKYVIVPIVNT